MNSAYSSMGTLLAEMRVLIPTDLLGEAGWEKVLSLTKHLPVCVADSRFGFEFDLMDPRSLADFCVLLVPGSPPWAFYEREVELTGPMLIGPSVRDFLKEQTRDAQSFLNRTGAGVILEYDLAQSPAGKYGPPGVFIVTLGTADARKVRFHDDPEGLVTALESAAGWPTGAVDRRQVQRVWEAAPSGIVRQAGVMPGRGRETVRFILQGVANAEVEETLTRLEWPGDPSLASECLSDLVGLVVPRAALSLDVSAQGISSRLGLELFRPIEWYRTDPPGWKDLIERLVENAWCLPDRGDALKQWPGIETLFGRDGIYRVRQVINHVKLLIHEGEVSAKGYAAMDVRRIAE